MLFLLLILLLLAGWVETVLQAVPRATPPGEGATWSTLVGRLYAGTSRALERVLAERPALRAGVRRLVILPVEGPVLRRYVAATPGAGSLARHLEEVAQPQRIEADWFSRHVAEGRRVREGELGVRIRFEDLQMSGERLSALFAVELVPPAGPPEILLPSTRYEGSSVTLPWFIARRSPWFVRAGLGALGLALLAGGGYLAYLYFWLVEGRRVGPRAWAPALNRLRAATGLIASSLLLLSGFLLIVLTFLLAPSTGQGLGVRRVHLDLLVDCDEQILPVSAFLQPSNALADVAADLGTRVMGALEMQAPESQEAPEDTAGGLAWMRRRLPAALRTAETRLRINRGASWRIFAASEGQVVAADPELQWPDVEPGLRRRNVLDALDEAVRRMPERGFGLPVPWQTNGTPPLDAATVAALGGAGTKDEPGRHALLVISAFQAPSRDYAVTWMAACSNRPPGSRIYGVMLPGLARSANREWESYEGRLLSAICLCDRVAVAQAEPPEIATNDFALAALGIAPRRPLRPDAVVPVFSYDGLGMRWIRNAAVPTDLAHEAAIRFSADRVQRGALDRLAMDIRNWMLGGHGAAEHTLVFTIPRRATYLLVLGLGLVFVVAGVRSEQNAAGIPGWLPPAVLAISAVALPLLGGLWVHARHDTTRYVVFGFADLAFWGVLFLWLCVGVAPFFLGRAHGGLARNRTQFAVLAAALAIMAGAPLLHGTAREIVAQFAVFATAALAASALALSLVRRQGGASFRLTLLLFVAAAGGYQAFWGAEGQDLSAVALLCTFLVMVASGWSSGVSWWQVTRHVEYDHIPWLRPAQRLLFAFMLSLAGAATLYCSFPAVQATGLIRGYTSHSAVLTLLPYLLCAGLVVLVDALERDVA